MNPRNSIIAGIFDAWAYNESMNRIKDDFKSEDYYRERLSRLREEVAHYESTFESGEVKDEVYYYSLLADRYLKIFRLSYLLGLELVELRAIADHYCDVLISLSELDNLTFNQSLDALSLTILLGLDNERAKKISAKMPDEDIVDVVYGSLRNYILTGEAWTDKEFYLLPTGYYRDGVKTYDGGLVELVKTKNPIECQKIFINYLDGKIDDFHDRLLRHYGEQGEEHYLYTGAFFLELTAFAKIRDLVCAEVARSPYIADDLL